MNESIESLHQEWLFIRECTKSFINKLSDEELDKILPRKGLNTIRKHFEEMMEVQKDYIMAITNGNMVFNSKSDSEVTGKMSKEEILVTMETLDKDLIKVLSEIDTTHKITWFGHEKFIAFHLSALVAHESFHMGQFVAFCYTLDLPIPEYVIKNWALSGR